MKDRRITNRKIAAAKCECMRAACVHSYLLIRRATVHISAKSFIEAWFLIILPFCHDRICWFVALRFLSEQGLSALFLFHVGYVLLSHKEFVPNAVGLGFCHLRWIHVTCRRLITNLDRSSTTYRSLLDEPQSIAYGECEHQVSDQRHFTNSVEFVELNGFRSLPGQFSYK